MKYMDFFWLHPFLLPHWENYVFVKIFFFEILVSEYSEWSKTSRNVIFSWHPDVCVFVRVCVCVRFSTFDTPITHKRLEISTWNLARQWSNHNPLIVNIFTTIDARFVILWDFEFFEKGRRTREKKYGHCSDNVLLQ